MPTMDSQTGSSHASINGHSEPANRPPDNLTILGIAAATGGLAPLRSFLTALPPTTGMAFVVVAHLAPDEMSALPGQLRSAGALPVTQMRTRVALAHNHIYIIPPGKRVLVAAGHLELAELDPMWAHSQQLLEADQLLQNTRQEYQTSLEELRAANEALHDEGLPEAIRWLATLMQQHGLAVTIIHAPLHNGTIGAGSAQLMNG